MDDNSDVARDNAARALDARVAGFDVGAVARAFVGVFAERATDDFVRAVVVVAARDVFRDALRAEFMEFVRCGVSDVRRVTDCVVVRCTVARGATAVRDTSAVVFVRAVVPVWLPVRLIVFLSRKTASASQTPMHNSVAKSKIFFILCDNNIKKTHSWAREYLYQNTKNPAIGGEFLCGCGLV